MKTTTKSNVKSNKSNKSNCARNEKMVNNHTASNCTTQACGKSASNNKNCKKACKNSQESETDPDGSYTGNPAGRGKYAKPVQDADDL